MYLILMPLTILIYKGHRMHFYYLKIKSLEWDSCFTCFSIYCYLCYLITPLYCLNDIMSIFAWLQSDENILLLRALIFLTLF